MEIERERAGLLARLRSAPRPFTLVPTMGGLHEGHLSLVRKGREIGGTLVASVFVNPLQFGPDEDFQEYPRAFDADAEKLRDLCDILYAPAMEEMYPGEQTVRITLPPVAGELCGASRPGFFEGVAVVVSKLFNLIRPDAAVFGKKDYQQATIVRIMAGQMDYPVRIILGETVREDDGLAMSSRNAYLTPAERDKAPALHRILRGIANAIEGGRKEPDIDRMRRDQIGELERLGFDCDYLEVRNARRLEPPAFKSGERLVVLSAATLGKCRLIDNCEAVCA